MRLWAHSRVRNRGLRGKLERTWMSLSEKSKLSWGCRAGQQRFVLLRDGKGRTPATPRFSIEGILWPISKNLI
jgi:hypothetical protein